MKKPLLLALLLSFGTAHAATDCDDLPDWQKLKDALTKARQENNGGLNLDMWATIVDRSGKVCAVTFTGKEAGDQWPGSRVISAQKANTANGFSLPAKALSTAQIYSGAQPGGFLYGIQHSNPVDVGVAYKGPADRYGQKNDPMVDNVLGGINVFGGGLALYNKEGTLLGAIGVSGDTSCADHNIAWRTRKTLGLDFVPSDDNIAYLGKTEKPNGFKHVMCGNKEHTIKLPPMAKK